ncbi:MAG TPA: hypothetical protein VJ110_01545 [Candidatus Nanoarchaeia archaeon]|nr:hypothetical protein [Candidatus Nanoarchaeia archaeon]
MEKSSLKGACDMVEYEQNAPTRDNSNAQVLDDMIPMLTLDQIEDMYSKAYAQNQAQRGEN